MKRWRKAKNAGGTFLQCTNSSYQTHRARGPEGTFHERDPLFHVRGQSSFTQRGQGRDQSRRGRGRVGQGHDGTQEHPVYLAHKINEICRSFDDLDLGDKEEIACPNKCGQGNSGGSCSNLNRGHHQGGIRSTQPPSKGKHKGTCTIVNEGEGVSLLTCGLCESTTNDKAVNFGCVLYWSPIRVFSENREKHSKCFRLNLRVIFTGLNY